MQIQQKINNLPTDLEQFCSVSLSFERSATENECEQKKTSSSSFWNSVTSSISSFTSFLYSQEGWLNYAIAERKESLNAERGKQKRKQFGTF